MHISAFVGICLSVGAVLGASLLKGAEQRPNIVIILADDLGFSDVGCYGSEIATPNLDRLADRGLRFTQFYNSARCCPTRAALITGLYPHQAGVGHMLGSWHAPGYTNGLNERCVTIADLLRAGGYRTYHVGKWHVGGAGNPKDHNYPRNRGFDRAYGPGGGGNYFAMTSLYLDGERVPPGPDFYATDAFTDYAVKFIEGQGREHDAQPFFLHLCYTAPHFPLQAKPQDIAKYRGKYRAGWDELRRSRYAREKQLGVIEARWPLSPRDPVARPWNELSDADKDEWDQRMSVYAAMIDCLDQGVGRVLDAVRKIGAEENTVVMFLSDNGASAEAVNYWPDPTRGHKPGSVIGTRESFRCLEVGWANAANTPFREHKMWVHEGGIATPLIVSWPRRVTAHGTLTPQVGHVIDLLPTCLELAGVTFPKTFEGREPLPPEGRSLVPVFLDKPLGPRTLAWEHEGNRAIRAGDWKLVAAFRGPWALYDLKADRSELEDLSAQNPDKVKELAGQWQSWADRVGVVSWEKLPGASYKPSKEYRKKSEPVSP